MKIVSITPGNISILNTFISHITSPYFRYYNTRNPHNVLRNHTYTIIGLEGDAPVAYGHIDKENDTYWVGICVLEGHTRKGLGRQIFSTLMTRADVLGIPALELTVDADNIPAQSLYKKYGFVIQSAAITTTNLHMKREKPPTLSTSISLPVSYGEALDKLSILNIKLNKINDNRRADVENEYNAIHAYIAPLMIPDVCYHYDTLKHTNLTIWDMQDVFRESNDISIKNKLCNEIIVDNDRRFRIKHKINALLNSSLKEQKGYAPRKAFVLSHLGLGDMITSIGLVRYLSTSYDSVTVVCKRAHAHNVRMFYSDDPTIQLNIQNDDAEINPEYRLSKSQFDALTAGHTVIAVGNHAHGLGKNIHGFMHLPYNFYADADLPVSVFWTYFHVAMHPESTTLYQTIPSGTPYIIMHSGTSTGPVFTIEQIEKEFGIDRNTTLCLDVNTNVYPTGHPYYETTARFLNQPLVHYKDTLIHAAAVIVTDSSFFCLAMQLPIESPHCYVVSRNGRDYSYMYNPEFGFDVASGRKKFKQIKF
jgi:GNAT superfamily N-acetyltransferase